MKNSKEKKRILIVEDDPNFLLILQKKLEGEGFLVLTAQDGKEGLSVFQKEKVDLIVSDLLLPVIDGVEMIKKIREVDSKIPVILLTNIKDKSPSKEIIELKRVAYLIKSEVSLKDIVEEIKKMLE